MSLFWTWRQDWKSPGCELSMATEITRTGWSWATRARTWYLQGWELDVHCKFSGAVCSFQWSLISYRPKKLKCVNYHVGRLKERKHNIFLKANMFLEEIPFLWLKKGLWPSHLRFPLWLKRTKKSMLAYDSVLPVLTLKELTSSSHSKVVRNSRDTE